MWMLSLIPDSVLLYVINGVLIVGLVGTAVSTLFKFAIRFIPWIIPYRTILQVVSIVLLVVGVYLRGGYGVEMSWRGRVAEAEEKVRVAEAAAKEANSKLETKVVDRVKVVKDVQIVIQEKIKLIEQKVDAECKIAPEAIDLLNQAARKPEVKK
jgi:uncharacterized membrane protein